MIYFAPLQGFTDYIYRRSFAQIFTSIDAFFVPYIALKGESVKPGYVKEIEPDHNPKARVVPQVLVKDSKELLHAVKIIADKGYREVNLNVGCPYPMVTKRGKGAGLLPYPNKVEALLNDYYKNCNLDLSVKLRAGLNSSDEIENIVPVLNRYPLKEVILHPRTASQLYKGDICEGAFQYTSETLKHELIFNGDIIDVPNFNRRKEQFPLSKAWMIGRGILMNPFLPSEITGLKLSTEEKKVKLHNFHQLILQNYLSVMDNEGNALNKLKQFWFYFSFNFNNSPKAFKMIKKTKSLAKYKSVVSQLYAEYN